MNSLRSGAGLAKRGRDSRRVALTTRSWFSVSSPAVCAATVAFAWLASASGYWQHLGVFDTVMAQDMAQIAQNMLHGDWLVTRYLTPSGLSLNGSVHDHPDFIRYPVPIHVYATLMWMPIAPSALVKLLNALLVALNAALTASLALSVLDREAGESKRSVRLPVAGLVGACSAALNFAYLRLAVSDAYEVMATTLLLLALWLVGRRKSPWQVGAVGALLYLARPNLGVFIPMLILIRAWMESSRKHRIRALLLGCTGTIVLIAPLLVRNYVLTGRFLLSLQSLVEFAKGVSGTHAELYRGFDVPGSVFEVVREHPSRFLAKAGEGIRVGLGFLWTREYWPVVPGLALAIVVLREHRRLVVTYTIFLGLHVLALSAFLQLERVYAPVYHVALSLGWSALAVLGLRRVSKLKSPRLPAGFGAPWVVLAAALCIGMVPAVAGSEGFAVKRDLRTSPPSSDAVALLKSRHVGCVYSNVPFWIPSYTDAVAVYAPTRLSEMATAGPEECNYFLYDRRRGLSRRDARELKRLARRVASRRGADLYRLR